MGRPIAWSSFRPRLPTDMHDGLGVEVRDRPLGGRVNVLGGLRWAFTRWRVFLIGRGGMMVGVGRGWFDVR